MRRGDVEPQTYGEINRIFPGFNGGHTTILGPEPLHPNGVGDLWHAPGSQYADPLFSWEDKVTPVTVGFIKSPKMGCDNVGDLLVSSHNCRGLYRFNLAPWLARFR